MSLVLYFRKILGGLLNFTGKAQESAYFSYSFGPKFVDFWLLFAATSRSHLGQ